MRKARANQIAFRLLSDQPMPGPFRLRPNMTKGPGDEVGHAAQFSDRKRRKREMKLKEKLYNHFRK